MRKEIYLFAVLISILVLSSCNNKEKDVPITEPLEKYETGVFVINEGNFGSGNGSISYLNTDKKEISSEIFQLENTRNLGDVIQSMNIVNDLAFICVNNSNKIEVVNSKDFKEQGVIIGTPSVRYYMDVYSELAYASCWGNGGQIKVIHTPTFEVVDSIMVGDGPEGMIVKDNKLFVANSGGLGVDSTVSVINMTDNEVIKTIKVGYSPKHMVTDANGNIWVLCAGAGAWSSIGAKPSTLVRIDPIVLGVDLEIELFTDKQPASIGIDHTGNVLAIGGGFGVEGIYKIFVNAPEMPTEPAIDGFYYGFNISPYNGDIFATDAGDYTNNGTVYHFTFLGEEIENYETGIIPNGVCFRFPVPFIK